MKVELIMIRPDTLAEGLKATQQRGIADPDTGGVFTVKRYSSGKEAESIQILAEFITVLSGAM